MNKILVIPLSDPFSVEYLYFTSIASCTFIERLCWIAKKAGFINSVIIYPNHADDFKKALNRAPGQVSRSLVNSSIGRDSTLVFLKPDIFPTVKFLKNIPDPKKKDTLFSMGENSPVMFIKTTNISKLSEILHTKPKNNSIQETLCKAYPSINFDLDNKDYYTVSNHDDIPRVEKSLYKGLIKDSESFMSRYFERKISLAITKQLINTSITPNQMSLISIGIGLIGGYFLSFPYASLQTFGALLFLMHSILDGCDGEIARLKYMESRWGGILDFWGDNIVHSAVFLGIGLAWKESAGALALWCSGFAIAGSLLSAGLVYVMTMRSKKEDGPLFTSISINENKDRWVRIADYLSRRDFIYLVVILAIYGKLEWFLVLAAVGAPLFFLFTLRINLKK